MKLQLSVILLLLSFHAIPTISQHRSETVKLLSIRNQDDHKAIPYSSIANKRSALCFQTDYNGYLRINVSEGDTIMFRCIGYRDTTMIITSSHMEQDSLIFNAQIKPQMLKDVDVFAFYSYASFKYRFANLKVEPDKKAPILINFDLNIKEMKAIAKAESGSAISIGLGALYGKTSQQKYSEFLAREEKLVRIKNLTSHENIMEFTGLKGETLDSFLVFLRARFKFESSQTDYQIMETVQIAYNEFLARNNNK